MNCLRKDMSWKYGALSAPAGSDIPLLQHDRVK